ncbi:MAG: protein translocase subunit SecD [Clostridia bacterium]|nr:protein translocase subunit SecD [Clostridia bacterium]
MKKKSIVTLCFVIALAIILNYVAFIGFNIAGYSYDGAFGTQGIKRGIDIAGGSVITFQAQTENPTEDQMQTVESIFQTRMTSAGYTEARISQGEAGKITVEIPSVTNTDEAAELLGNVAKLTFNDADGNVVLDGATDVKDASYQFGPTTQNGPSIHYIQIEFNPEAKDKFAEATRTAATKAAEGKNFISIQMDGTAISNPSVQEEINSNTCIISGGFESAEEAQMLANQIKSGNLPFDLAVISKDTVGAELGPNALKMSLIAAAIGILHIMIFMVVVYRLPGLIADISLLIYVGLIGLAMGAFHVNLSLSGIAGIVLSIGMAVDADCIIFERMKEELKLGKTIRASVASGFDKAFSAILDSNVTTIISCIVLYISGIGAVTGFATTLGIGVVLSMFTAIIITKFLLKQLVGIGVEKRSLFYSTKAKKGGAEE